MRNLKLTIAYDGTDFRGWQIQREQPTIQGLLTDAVRQITQESVTLYGAGRTDAGVHAWGQVASFKTRSALAPHELQRGCNALLPPSIRVRDAEEVGPDFHARWDAQAKTYTYSLYRGAVVPPFRWRYVLHVPQELDFAAMAEAARCFVGERDFTSFAASTGSEDDDKDRNMVRSVFRSELVGLPLDLALDRAVDLAASASLAASAWPGPLHSICGRQGSSEEWVYVIRGRSFLRYMVRKIVGTILKVGRGRMGASDIPALLEKRDRRCSGPTAPPHGLCLQSIEYPDPADLLTSAPPGASP